MFYIDRVASSEFNANNDSNKIGNNSNKCNLWHKSPTNNLQFEKINSDVKLNVVRSFCDECDECVSMYKVNVKH